MGQQVLTLAGQVVGGYFFGPVGAAVGGAIGGAIGGALFNEDVVNEGPRLTDLHVQTSSYGNAVPILKGTVRCAGNVIWSTDIRETAIETEEDGKGGPTISQVNYSYDLDCAVALCEGPIIQVERIFANGVLIFDNRLTANPQSVYASGLWATGIRLYDGSETQLPDPTIEAAVGVGNASAYRGTAYLMINGLQLNVLKTATIPNFEFVVVQAGTVTQFSRILAIDNISPSYTTLTTGIGRPRVTVDEGVIRVANTTNLFVYQFDLAGNELGPTTQNLFESSRPAHIYDTLNDLWGFWAMFDEEVAYVSRSGIDPVDLFIDDEALTTYIAGSPSREFVAFTQCADNASIFGFTRNVGSPTGFADEWIRFRWTGDTIVIDDRGGIDASVVINGDLGLPTAAFGNYAASFGESDLRSVWAVQGSGSGSVRVFQVDDTGTMVLLKLFTGGGESIFDYAAGFSTPSIWADRGLAYIVADDSVQVYSRLIEVDSDGVPLSEVVSDICDRSGIPSAEYDVTALTQTVEGFVIGQTMTGRAAIEALRPGYYFDAVDGDKLKFVNRGSTSVVTFAYDDLGAGEGDAQRVAVQAKIAQETELPARVNVSYISKDMDYQIGAQSARRETTNSRETMTAEIPAVFTDAVAAQVADVNLRDQWAGSIVRNFNTGLKYSKYEPTDVISVDDGDYVRVVRLTRRVDRGGMIEWESRDEDAAVYTSNAPSFSITIPGQTMDVPGPTDVEVLDLPPLTELSAGNEASAYVAAKGVLSGWTGASIEVSRDGGAVYTQATIVSAASIMGVATTLLPDFLGGNVFDEASVVRVAVGSATLSSSTHTLLLNGANPVVIGDEILQFRTATLISAGVYDLTGLLRGRKGTEWAMSTHVVGERFVFLSTNLRNIPLLVADSTNVNLLVRGATAGTISGAAMPEHFSTQLARLKPYSPAHLSAVRDANGAWYLSWLRRDRYMNDWNDGVDVPMSEAVELFDIDVLNVGGEVVETYTDIPDEFYTVPFDVLGGSPTPISITYRAYQRSAIVGRGFVAEATITQAL